MGQPAMGGNTPPLTQGSQTPTTGGVNTPDIVYSNFPQAVDPDAVRANPQGYLNYQAGRQAQSQPQAPTVPATDGGNRGGMSQQPAQPNIFQQSSGAYNDALSATRQGINAPISNVQSQNVQGQGYNPTTGRASVVGSTGYNAAQMSAPSNIGFTNVQGQQVGSQGYNASTMQGVDPVRAQNVAAQNVTGQGYGAQNIAGTSALTADQVSSQDIASGMSRYQDPYEQQVVDTTLKDLERQRQMQINDVGSSATAAGAFGGSRQGVMEAETNRAAQDVAARTAAQLRSQGFSQAATLSGQDVQNAQQAALANQSANLQAGTTTRANQLQTQLANQQAQNQASQFSAGAANQANLANQQAQLNAQQSNQSANLQAGTTTAGNQLATQQTNVGAQNQASQFGANAANQATQQQANLAQQAALANQSAGIQTGIQNAANQMSTNQFNAGAQNQASQFGAGAQNTANLANQSAQNQMALANMGAFNQAGQFGASATNQANLANQSANMQAQLANQSAQQQLANRMLSGGAQLGNLSNLGFGMGNTLTANQQAAGNQQQQLMQQLINAGRAQTQGYYNSPQNALNTLIGAYSGSQTGQRSQQNTMTPGLLDYLTAGATLMPRG